MLIRSPKDHERPFLFNRTRHQVSFSKRHLTIKSGGAVPIDLHWVDFNAFCEDPEVMAFVVRGRVSVEYIIIA